MNIKIILSFAAITVLAGCATSGQRGPQPRAISYKEASAFENSMLARKPTAPAVQKKLYNQPVNKKEACKLPTSQDQLDRPNYREYWDGECKNCFAFGLGRDIVISDTERVDEITIHSGTGDDWSEPRVDYDYVNNVVLYAIGGSKFPALKEFTQKFDDSVSGFNAYRTLRVIDESGNGLNLQTSAFSPTRIYTDTRVDHSISYMLTDYSAAPAVNPNAVKFKFQMIDPKSKTKNGIAIVAYANGSIRQFKVVNGKAELVSLPTDYAAHLQAKIQEAVNATSQANASLQRAQQIEREYLYKACNGKSGINGLDNAIYTKICTWRDQFKEPYAIASANYQKQLESLKQQAATAEQQRRIQQQIALQQLTLQQQQNQQTWNEVNQASQQLQQRNQQIMQGVNSWQPPQVQPITPPSGNRVICTTTGILTSCR